MPPEKCDRTVALIDTIDSAAIFLADAQGRFDRFIAVSLHPLVESFLQRQGVPCADLSTYITNDEFSANLRKGERAIVGVLQRLDDRHAADLSACLGLTTAISWFVPLYLQGGRYDLAGIFNGLQGLKRALERHAPDRVAVYGGYAYSAIDATGDIHDLLKVSATRNGFRGAIDVLAPAAAAPVQRGWKSIARQMVEQLQELRNFVTWRRDEPVTILLDQLYDFEFLKRTRGLRSTLVWSDRRSPQVLGGFDVVARADIARLCDFARHLDLIADGIEATPGEEDAAAVLLHRVQRDFRRKIETFGRSLVKVKQLLQTAPVKRAIWGVDPLFGAKALRVECLMRAGVKVIGGLHGNGYGTHYCNEQNYAAHSRCDVFLSYGYTDEDVAITATNPDWKRAVVVPVGAERAFTAAARWQTAQTKRSAEVVDLFYPITNNYSVLSSSQRAKVDWFLDLQRSLLASLDKVQGRRILAKLPTSVDAPSALALTLPDMRNVSTTTENVLRLMRTKNVKAVLIDASYSTCLLEVLPFNCEVFVLDDPLMPLSARALELLERRVHYLCSAQEFEERFTAYLAGAVPPRRDRAFEEHYLFAHSRDVRARVLEVLSV